MGPFTVPPFMNKIGVSPLSSHLKKDSEQRCIILDLSFPFGASVNNGIDKNMYCGEPVKLTYPTINTLAHRVVQLGSGCLLWKCDLARYFRQVPLCPCDYCLIGIRWRGLLYFDKVMPMGLRSTVYVCQRLTNAVVFIHRKAGHWSINYLDDFGSAELQNQAWQSYFALHQILIDIGLEESTEKVVPPSTHIEFLGTTVDMQKMTLEI